MAGPWEKYGSATTPAADSAAPWQKYGGEPSPAAPAPPDPSMNASISAEPQPHGIGEHVTRWAKNVADDIKYGTDVTGIGSVLKKMGAHGVYNGNSKEVGDYMASLPLGLMKMAQGGGEVATEGKRVQGAKDVASGALQAATMPSAFVGGPEASTVGQGGVATKAVSATAKVAKEGAGKVASLVPTTEHAGKAFSEVMSAAGDIPINVSKPGDTALRIQDLANSGGSMPKVVRDFLKRVTDPDKGPMTYSEGRDFLTNASRLSADEKMRLTPVMKFQVARFTDVLNKAVEQAASQGGKLKEYQDAMQEYHKAMQLKALGKGLKDAATGTAAKVVAGTGAGAIGAYLTKKAIE